MSLEKLAEAVKSAMGYLKDSKKTVSKGDEDVGGLVWRAAAELEYALFLFSVMHQGASEGSAWKLRLRLKDIEVNSVLSSTIDLLKEAESIMEDGDLLEAHKKTWMARGYLLKLHTFFEKQRKRKKTGEKSS
jgi:hypothetical protein